MGLTCIGCLLLAPLVLLDTSAEVMTMAVAVAPSSGTGIGNGDDEETEDSAQCRHDQDTFFW
jgi:hypothetical protein